MRKGGRIRGRKRGECYGGKIVRIKDGKERKMWKKGARVKSGEKGNS